MCTRMTANQIQEGNNEILITDNILVKVYFPVSFLFFYAFFIEY